MTIAPFLILGLGGYFCLLLLCAQNNSVKRHIVMLKILSRAAAQIQASMRSLALTMRSAAQATAALSRALRGMR